MTRKSLAIPIGCVLVALGLLLSGAVLEATILPRGTIVGTERRALALMICRIGLVVAGAYFLVRRPRLTAVHLAALVPGTLVAGMLAVVALQVAYKPPAIVSGWRAFGPPEESNEFGYRGRPIEYSDQDYVILLVGDSHVESVAMPFDRMPERRLEAHLNELGLPAKVFSLGAGGYGQDQELLAAETYFKKYRADLILVWETAANDIWNNTFPTHLINRNPKPTFWLDESNHLQGPSEAMDAPLGASPLVIAALWQRAFVLPKRDQQWERRLPPVYQPMDHYDGPVRMEWQQWWDTDYARMRDEEFDTEKTHLSVMLVPRSPRTQYGLDLTKALLRRIKKLGQENGAQMIVFQHTTEDPMYSSDHDEVFALNGKFYKVSARQSKENWEYVNQSFQAEYVPVTVAEWRVSEEDGHLNEQATDQVMTDLAMRVHTRITARLASEKE